MRRTCIAFGLLPLLTGAALAEHPAMTPAAIATDQANFRQCVQGLVAEAPQHRVPSAVAARELGRIEPEMRLLESMRAQPEFERPLWQYIAGLVTDARVAEGREMMTRHRDLLQRVSRATGVQPQFLVALWGVETNFGKGMGERPILRSTTTLACIGRRKDFFRRETFAALRIVSEGHIAPESLRGSWAGAFGHTQFMPSTFFAHAVDFDGDGRRDLIGSLADALASTATMLKRDGWEPGKTWGYEVALPPNFDFRNVAGGRHMTLAEWSALGIRRPEGQGFPRPRDQAALVAPAGVRGPAFLVLQNFQALRRYNGSEAYAFALGHLADRIVGGEGFRQPWPVNLPLLSRAERQELQILLTRLGFDTGGTDGAIGNRTRDALRAFQFQAGAVADGFPTHDALRQVRARANQDIVTGSNPRRTSAYVPR